MKKYSSKTEEEERRKIKEQTEEIAKKVEDSVNLLKNLNKTLFEGLKE